jgi:hypothetical protein
MKKRRPPSPEQVQREKTATTPKKHIEENKGSSAPSQAQRAETSATIPQLRTEENKKVPAGIFRCRPEP